MSPTIPEQGWTGFQTLIAQRFAHATLYGLRIERGMAVSYQRVRFTKAFDRPTSSAAPAQRPLNERWAGFVRFCAAIGDGVVPEVHFRDGAPCLAQLEEPGQDLQALIRK